MSQIKKTEVEKIWLGGRLALKSSGNYIGSTEAVGYHDNGRLRFRYPMLDGQFHGMCCCWASNEQLIVEECYELGKLQGISKEWYESGAVKKQSVHLKGEPCSESSWHEQGQMASECAYLNGKLTGLRRVWYPDGKLKSQYEYHEGHPVSGKQWHPSGLPACEEALLEGKLHGLQRGWYENGSPKHECCYVSGRQVGVHRTWFSDGQMQSEYHYKEGRRHGLCRVWGKAGDLRIRRYWLRDVLIPRQIAGLIENGMLNAKAILRIKNAAVRRICLEEYGYARFLSQVEHEVVDREGEQELVKLRWHSKEEILALVKVKCPSTGAFYTLRVPPGMKTVKAAVAWTFDVKPSEYNPVKET